MGAGGNAYKDVLKYYPSGHLTAMSGIRQGTEVIMTGRKAGCLTREGTLSNGRTALLIRCSDAEAKLIRAAANHERRTLSGYVVNAALERMVAHGPMTRDSDLRPAPRNGV